MSNSKKEKASRRTFLQRAAVGATGLISGAALAQDNVASDTQVLGPDPFKSMKVPGRPVGSNLYGVPSRYERASVRHLRPADKQYLSSSSRSPLQELDGIITPNGLFYERHHNGIPTIDPAEHKLLLHGLVERPLIFTLDDLRRFPSESKIYFLECSGNPDYKVFGKTAAEANGLVSCAEWTGVKLKTVLQEAGVKSSAKWIIAEGADGAGLNRSIPIEKCMDDALLVYSQNGERLRPEQGYPLRLFLPGFEGNMSVKWLRRLEVSDIALHSREETSKYTDLYPDGKAREFSFVMEAKSIITRPSGQQKLAQKGFHQISGIAWSGRGKIARVEVSVDDGRTWSVAQLQSPVLDKALTRFRFPWAWDGSSAVILSRAVDETGYVQPSLEDLVKTRGVNSVYHNNAITKWKISENGEITNARLS